MERANWKLIIGTTDGKIHTNFVYGVTYEEAYASLYRQIECKQNEVLSYVIVEA